MRRGRVASDTCDGSSRASRAVRGIVHILLTAPAVFLVLLSLHPRTGWLLRAHCRLLYSSQDAYVALKDYRAPSTPQPVWFRRRLAEVAQQHPDDYLIQLASLVEHRLPSEVDLRSLLPRFGNRPALLAHILRYDVVHRLVPVLHTARLETNWLYDLQALRQHAGKYYAEQLGKAWPS